MKKIFLFLSFFIAATAHSQTDGYAKSSDAAAIYYRTFGSGKPILIINGGPGMNSNGFEALAKNFRPVI